MDTAVIILFLSLAIIAVMLFFELKNTQRDVRELRGELERKMELGISQVSAPVSQIPLIAERISQIERRVAEQSRDHDESPADPARNEPTRQP